jgi:serine/threonine protein kinase
MISVGSLVAGYRIEQVIATGATGTVYLAKNPSLPRNDALKVLSADLSQDPQFRDRFVREADIASRLDHPNIVAIYSRGEAENGQLWIAMQYVAGTDAEAALLEGSMSPMRAIRIVGEVAKALDYAHQRNVVHHDVKLANVLLSAESDDDEHALLGDFGVARAIGNADQPDSDSTLTATLAYAAPEVITGGHVDGRADVYSLGCTLFRLLTGRQPFFDAEGTTAVARAHLHQTPPRISDCISGTSPQLDWVMAKVLAKNAAERFESAREFAHAADEALRRPASPAALHHDRRHAISHPAETAPRRIGGPSGDRPAVRMRPTAENDWPPASVARSHDVNRLERVTITHTPPPRRQVPKRLIVIGAAAAVAIALGLAWSLWPSPGAPMATSPGPSTTATTPSSTAAQDQLTRLLPAGYPPGTCKPTDIPESDRAAVACGPNTDPGGPTSATYTLARDPTAVRAAFNDAVNRYTAVICPPNIQSPGAWQRNDSPTVPRGTLFCGIQAGQPLVAWTNDAQLVLNIAHGDAPATRLDGLYTWWSSHS